MAPRCGRSTWSLEGVTALAAKPFRIGALPAITVASLGGAFFALFSCGGHIWHAYVFCALIVGSTVFALFAWRPASGRLWKTVAFLVALVATYQLVQAAVAPIYLAPNSASEYLRMAIDTLRNGPC